MDTLNTSTRDENWLDSNEAFRKDKTFEVERGDILDIVNGRVLTADGSVFRVSEVVVIDSVHTDAESSEDTASENDDSPSVDPASIATDYFRNRKSIVTPTADAQRWRVPGTEHYLKADEAREISLSVRRELGNVAV